MRSYPLYTVCFYIKAGLTVYSNIMPVSLGHLMYRLVLQELPTLPEYLNSLLFKWSL
jgi:hypothetical protein